jgi:beta-aspartyl-peptidase (threonine type)
MVEFIVSSNWPWGVVALRRGKEVLERGASALDSIEETIRMVEDDPTATSVGTGGLPNADGVLELDASIMDGTNMRAGAVAALQMTKNPISVARKVMELTPHVLLAGDGAKKFARQCGFPEYDPLTAQAVATWKKLRETMLSSVHDPTSMKRTFDEILGYDTDIETLAKSLMAVYGEHLGGTVGVLARDERRNIAAGASTSGWAMRFPGRVADTAITGAGTYANKVAAATSTGVGEVAIRHSLARSVCELVESGLMPDAACEAALRKVLAKEKFKHLIAVTCIDIECNVGGSCTKSGFQYQYMLSGDSQPVIVRPEPIRAEGN